MLPIRLNSLVVLSLVVSAPLNSGMLPLAPSRSLLLDTQPPLINFDGYGGASPWRVLKVSATFCDNATLNPTTADVQLNGGSIPFTYATGTLAGCTAYAHADATISLNLGSNTLYAEIADNAGNFSSYSRVFKYGVMVQALASGMTTGTSTSDSTFFTVQNTSSTTRVFTLSSVCVAPATTCGVSPSSVTLDPWGVTRVKATYSTGVGTGMGQVSLTATNGSIAHTADAVVNVVSGTRNLVADWISHNYDNAQPGLCAAGCFAARYAMSTVPYFSLDQPRSVTLTYNSDAVAVRPIISVDVNLKTVVMNAEYWLEAKDSTGATITFVNGDTKLRFKTGSPSTTRVRLNGQFDASAYPSGVYPISVTLTVNYGATTESQTYNTKFAVANERKSSIARGWTIAGYSTLRVMNAYVAIVSSDGGVALFSGGCAPACNIYTSPYGDYTTLTSSGTGASLKYTRTFPDSSQAQYDNNGKLQRLITRTLDTTSFTYDVNGRVSQISDPFRTDAGNVTHLYTALAYSGTGTISSITEPGPNKTQAGGRSTQIVVAADSTLTNWKDPDFAVSALQTILTYDASKRLRSVKNRSSDSITFAYQATTWKVDSSYSPNFAVSPHMGGLTIRIKTKLTPWMTASVPTTSTSSTLWTPYASDTVRGRSSTVNGPTSQWTVDRWGQPMTITTLPGDALQRVDSMVRRPYSALVDHTRSHEGRLEFLAYDHAKVTRDSVFGITANQSFFTDSMFAQPDSVKQKGTPTQVFRLGPRGRTDTVIVAGTLKYKYTYDSRYRVTVFKDAADHTSNYYYNTTFGSLDSVKSPGRPTQRTMRDGIGRDTASQVGTLPWQRHRYDLLNRDTLTIADANAGMFVSTIDSTHVSYAAESSHQVTVKDPVGTTHTYTYNALGMTTQITDPLGNLDKFWPDSLGQVTTWRNRRSDTLITRYDKLGRKTLDSLKVGATTQKVNTFGYATNGLSASMQNAASHDSIYTDATGFVTRIVTQLATDGFAGKVVRAYTKDSVSRPDSTHITYPGSIAATGRKFVFTPSNGTVSNVRVNGFGAAFTYNAELNDSVRTLVTTDVTTYSALTNHELYRASFNNAAMQTAFWRGVHNDSIGRIDIGNQLTAAGLERRRHTYDGRGRLVFVRDSLASGGTLGTCEGAANADYGEITTCAATFQWRDSLQYNRLGNIKYVSDTMSLGTPTYSSTDSARLGTWPARAGLQTFTTDNAGNITQRAVAGGSTTNYYWSVDGLLDSVKVGTRNINYEYNALGQLVRKRVFVSGVEQTADRRHFYWDRGQLLAELNSDLTGRRSEYAYYPGVDQPMAMLTGATSVTKTRYFQQDSYGNVIGLQGSGNVVENSVALSRPWGEFELWNGTANADTVRLRWKGLLWEADSTKLYYARARWYDPVTHRFMSQDPIGLAGGINPYAFAGNDPINSSDPSGLAKCKTEDVDRTSWVGDGRNKAYDNSGYSKTVCKDDDAVEGINLAFPFFPGGGGPRPLSRPKDTQDSRPTNNEHTRVCGMKVFEFAMTAAGDASVFLGAGAAIRALGVGVKFARSAEMIAATARLARTNRYAQAIAGRNAAINIAGFNVAEALGGYLSFAEIQHTVADVPNVSWRDIVPGFATVRDYEEMRDACWR